MTLHHTASEAMPARWPDTLRVENHFSMGAVANKYTPYLREVLLLKQSDALLWLCPALFRSRPTQTVLSRAMQGWNCHGKSAICCCFGLGRLLLRPIKPLPTAKAGYRLARNSMLATGCKCLLGMFKFEHCFFTETRTCQHPVQL